MEFVWKGRYKDVSQLDKGELPAHAVKFREPTSLLKLNLTALLFAFPVLLLIGFVVFLKRKLGLLEGSANDLNLLGILLAAIMIAPHEIIHALLFPKKAEVQFWYSVKSFSAFVYSTYPVSKMRFILISLAPNIIFGLIPLFFWIFIPENHVMASIVITFAKFSLLFGIGDYLNVFNAARQMPQGSMTQLSGFHSYWYRKEFRNGKNISKAV